MLTPMRTLTAVLLASSFAHADSKVFGQILDSASRDGGVVDFVFLKLKSPDDLDGDPVPVKTDRTGRFSLKLAPGAYRVGDIRKPSADDPRLFEANYARDLIEIGGAEEYDIGIIKLEKTGTYVSGVVRRAGKPAPDATVELFQPGSGLPLGASAKTDAMGRYELQLPDVKEPMAAAVQVAEKDGQAFAPIAVDLWKPGKADLEIPEKWFELLVDLTAPGETWIYLRPGKERAPYLMHKAKGTAKISVTGLAPGLWTITAVAPGATTTVEATVPAKDPVALALPAAPLHRVNGRVTVAGAPADFDWGGVAVVARPSDGGPAGYLWCPVGRDGSYTFPCLAAGKWELSVAAGKRFDAMRYFQVDRSAVAMPTLDLGAPRTIDLSVKAGDLGK
jgi:hypothetical protein